MSGWTAERVRAGKHTGPERETPTRRTTVDTSGEDPSTGTVVGRISGTKTLAVFSVSDDGRDGYPSLQLVPDDNTCPSGAATEPVKGTVVITG